MEEDAYFVRMMQLIELKHLGAFTIYVIIV
jgi:hypothetical protein